MAHHPEKFLDGRMLWRGRIYSPLPFVRSLWGTRINAGVWGTAAFPSVYRTDVHPFAFLPHSVKWQVLSFVLDARRRRRSPRSAAISGRRRCCSAPGWSASPSTIAKNVAYALRSDVDSLPGSRLWYRATVAYLHFIQPFARIRGRIRGVLSPPEVALPAAEPQTSRGPRPSLGEAWRALLLISGSVTEDRFWSETWTSTERVLAQLTDWLRRSRAVRTIEIDEGWSRRSRRQRARRPLGLARRPRAGRGARRRQERCCASARTCGRPASASSARSRSRAALLGGGDRRPGAALAAGRRRRRRLLALAIVAFARLAHRAGHRHPPARRRPRSTVGAGMTAMQVGSGAACR